MPVVISHPEMGIYLGHCLGLGFWTLLDTVGQPYATTFNSQTQAKEHIRSWNENNNPTNYSFVSVSTNHKSYATIVELKAAGLESILGEMEADALRYAEPIGQA